MYEEQLYNFENEPIATNFNYNLIERLLVDSTKPNSMGSNKSQRNSELVNNGIFIMKNKLTLGNSMKVEE